MDPADADGFDLRVSPARDPVALFDEVERLPAPGRSISGELSGKSQRRAASRSERPAADRPSAYDREESRGVTSAAATGSSRRVRRSSSSKSDRARLARRTTRVRSQRLFPSGRRRSSGTGDERSTTPSLTWRTGMEPCVCGRPAPNAATASAAAAQTRKPNLIVRMRTCLPQRGPIAQGPRPGSDRRRLHSLAAHPSGFHWVAMSLSRFSASAAHSGASRSPLSVMVRASSSACPYSWRPAAVAPVAESASASAR